jgi:predicted transcriptional regulator
VRLPKTQPRRSPIEIRASVLESLLEDDLTLSGIMRATGLNRETTRIQLDELIARGFIKKVGGSLWTRYSVTEKGVKWLRQYRTIADEVGSNRNLRDRH